MGRSRKIKHPDNGPHCQLPPTPHHSSGYGSRLSPCTSQAPGSHRDEQRGSLRCPNRALGCRLLPKASSSGNHFLHSEIWLFKNPPPAREATGVLKGVQILILLSALCSRHQMTLAYTSTHIDKYIPHTRASVIYTQIHRYTSATPWIWGLGGLKKVISRPLTSET